MRRESFRSKLKSVTALSASLLAGTAASPQIVYHDIDPDTVLSPGDTYQIDLNNDGTYDFNFFNEKSFSTVKSSAGIAFLHSQEGVVGYLSAHPFASALTDGTLIGAAQNWLLASTDNPLFFLKYQYTYYGEWDSVENKYAGLKLQIAGHTTYGWVRMDVNSAVTIKDFAYNEAHDTPINAGQISGVETASSEFASLVFYGKTLEIFLPPNLKDAQVSVFNSQGLLMLSQKVYQGKSDLDLNKFSSGIYLVRVQSSEYSYSGIIRL